MMNLDPCRRWSWYALLAAFVVPLPCQAQAPCEPAAGAPLDRLQGLWTFNSHTVPDDGVVIMPSGFESTVRITGDKWIQSNGTRARIKFKDRTNPREIALTFQANSSDGNAEAHHGLVKLGENRVSLCFFASHEARGQPPSAFPDGDRSVDGRAVEVWTLSRVDQVARCPEANCRMEIAIATGIDAQGQLLLRSYQVIETELSGKQRIGHIKHRMSFGRALDGARIFDSARGELTIGQARRYIRGDTPVVMIEVQPPYWMKDEDPAELAAEVKSIVATIRPGMLVIVAPTDKSHFGPDLPP